MSDEPTNFLPGFPPAPKRGETKVIDRGLAVHRCTCYVLPHADDCGIFIGITQSGERVEERRSGQERRSAVRAKAVEINDVLDVAECCVHDQIKDPNEREHVYEGLKKIRALALSSVSADATIKDDFIRAFNFWYERDGSVGGLDQVVGDHGDVLRSLSHDGVPVSATRTSEVRRVIDFLNREREKPDCLNPEILHYTAMWLEELVEKIARQTGEAK